MKTLFLILAIVSISAAAWWIWSSKYNFATAPSTDNPETTNGSCNAGICPLPGNQAIENQTESKISDSSVKSFANDLEKEEVLTEGEARAIAEKSCIKGGEALSAGTYNENSKTWWFDANLNAAKPGCNPACVVSVETKTAEINWRCTGAIPPASN